ncbi:MAG: Mfa1 family fimbria major subunit [Paramuribaculum sp.]|nr:Mfa1 family fimbria major subunit [Paramuribaculum sp.]
MNKISTMFLALAASATMFSCSSDEPAGSVTPSEGNIYATLTLSLPQGRSTTVEGDDNTNSDAGYENGNDKENQVGSVLVVLASKTDNGNYTYITSNLADAHPSTNANAARPTYNIQFETRELLAQAGNEVYVFAYCNPTTKLIEAANSGFQGGFVDATGNIEDASIWTANGFLMSNAYVTSSTLPSETQMNEFYNTPENPFNLGVVKVERTAARFDFKQTTVAGQNEANLYPIYNVENAEDGNRGELLGYVQLDGMSMINVAKNYYFLPRVSANGMDQDVTICGRETPNNYIVSPFAAQKTATALDLSFIRDNYLYNCLPVGAENLTFSTLSYDALSTSLGEDDDENWGDNISGFDKTGYHIWKYTVENTIPEVETQRKGITTGIVFKGHILPVKGSELETAMNGTNVIYAFNGVIYGNLEMLKKAVAAKPVSVLAETFKAAYNISDVEEETLAGITTDLTESKGFTIYRPVNGEYPVYYSYYNRHNDNGNNTVMAPMEFSVVRNNVYKIAVQNIIQFGHTGDPKDDPDPEDPDDPDETPKTYFRVQVQVLPWVVRVNNIIL